MGLMGFFYTFLFDFIEKKACFPIHISCIDNGFDALSRQLSVIIVRTHATPYRARKQNRLGGNLLKEAHCDRIWANTYIHMYVL